MMYIEWANIQTRHRGKNTLFDGKPTRKKLTMITIYKKCLKDIHAFFF